MRYNSFYRIHKGLRAMLYETASQLQRTDFENEQEANSILESIAAVVDLFDSHAHHEDTLIFPAVAAHEPSIVDAFEKEHEQDHELCTKLRNLSNVYPSLTSDAEKIQLGSAIRKSFVEFLTFNLVHMAKEEDIINNLLWKYYTDDEILVIEQKIVGGQSPEAIAIAAKWMIRGLSNQEIVRWFRVIQKNAPEHIFNNFFSLAEKELPSHRFREVIDGLTEGQMVL